MKSIRKTLAASAALAIVCLFAPAFATARTAGLTITKQNKDHATTAENQSNTSADRETTAKVRKAIMADGDNLSTYAHNDKDHEQWPGHLEGYV